MKKQSNPMPENAIRPDAPPAPPKELTVTERRMAIVFNEWAKRYAENPDEFSEILDADGKPVTDYGECCTHYFNRLAIELDGKGLLPRPAL